MACAVILAGCGGGLPRSTSVLTRPLDPAIDGAIDRMIDAARSGDAVAIRGLLGTAVSSGGIWFDDPRCREQFSAARAIGQEEVDRFAGCLATLALARSARTSETPGVAVLEYEPGIELEAAFQVASGDVTLRWIGYSGRRGATDVLPTITRDALEGLREGGPRRVAQASSMSTSWLKVCLDTGGAVRVVHPRSTPSPELLEVAVPIAKGWRFRPFTVGGQPVAVCAMVAVSHPDGDDVKPAALPLSLPDAFSDAIIMPSKRIAGHAVVAPDDEDRAAIRRTPDRRAASTWQLCLDRDGAVAGLTMMESSGFPRYDERVAAALATFRYTPVEVGGRRVAVCTVLTMIYQLK